MGGTGRRPPNFIIIFCDDLGYGDLGCYGSELNKTPRLDRMAEEGMRFTDFYVTASVCSPSRAALMTGCYPKRIGLASGDRIAVLLPGEPIGLHPDEVTLATLLKTQGYATKMIGKWHLGDQPPFMPKRHGFDSYFGLPYSNDMGPDHPYGDWLPWLTYPPLPLIREDKIVAIDPNQASLTDYYVKEAVQFLKENKDRPFFLYFSHFYVHVPIYAPHKYLDRSKNGPYGAAVEHIDYTTGVLLDTLVELGIDDETLVIFTSDNGSTTRGGGSNAPLRGGKATTWEGGLREPCIMRWPGKIPAGTTCEELCTAMDVFPTLGLLAGAVAPDDRVIDGKDIRPLILAEANVTSPYEAFYYYFANDLNAVRSGRWKLHLHEKLLFDLETDIGETKNVFDDHPDVVEKLEGYADICRKELGDASTGTPPGENCRPAGRVENPRMLTRLDDYDPYIKAVYD